MSPPEVGGVELYPLAYCGKIVYFFLPRKKVGAADLRNSGYVPFFVTDSDRS